MMKRVLGYPLVLILVLLASGCGGATPQVSVNVRPDYSRQLKDVFIVVRTDGIPAEFSSVFVANLDRLLTERGVETQVRQMTALDLNPVSDAELESHEHVLFIRPTHVLSNQYAVQSVTMNCTLLEVDTELMVMRADVVANKGWGTGFSKDEAENATAELVRHMAERRLLPPAPSDSTLASSGQASPDRD